MVLSGLSTEGEDHKIIEMKKIQLARKCRSLHKRCDKKLSGVSRSWLSDRLIGEGLEMLAGFLLPLVASAPRAKGISLDTQ